MSIQGTTPAVKSDDLILLLGRVALGAIFVKSGLQKLMALGAFAASLAGRGVPRSSVVFCCCSFADPAGLASTRCWGAASDR